MEFKRIVSSSMPDQPDPVAQNRKFYTSRSQRKQFIALWYKSARDKNKFCAQHNLQVQTFSRWLKKEKTKHAAVLPEARQKPSSVSDQQESLLKLKLPNGVSLIFTTLPEASWMRALIKEISICRFN